MSVVAYSIFFASSVFAAIGVGWDPEKSEPEALFIYSAGGKFCEVTWEIEFKKEDGIFPKIKEKDKLKRSHHRKNTLPKAGRTIL